MKVIFQVHLCPMAIETVFYASDQPLVKATHGPVRCNAMWCDPDSDYRALNIAERLYPFRHQSAAVTNRVSTANKFISRIMEASRLQFLLDGV